METKELKCKTNALDFAVEKSMRYHQRRRGHYDAWHHIFMFLTIICGSAAFAELSVYFGAGAAIFATVDLVWGLALRARNHEILFRRFSDLAVLIRTSNPTETLYTEWLNQRISIETDEPPIYWALEADCDNEVRRAWGRDKELVHIDRWHQLTMYWLRHTRHVFDVVQR